MKIVAVIAEYNPFHSGHAHLFCKIREAYGSDTAILVLMSGNYTQRGEIAIMHKVARARCAVLGGADLVLELPFPFCMGSAEFFARAAVSLLGSIAVADVLAFGSECGDTALLKTVASVINDPDFQTALKHSLKEKTNCGYPALVEKFCKDRLGERLPNGFFSSNDLLALEYLRSLEKTESRITPFTVRREGAAYRDAEWHADGHPSATAIRRILYENGDPFSCLPREVAGVVAEEIREGRMPCRPDALSGAILSSLLLTPRTPDHPIMDASGGLYSRLRKCCREATDLSSLIALSETKKYTTAHIRRAVWNCYFGVTSSEMQAPPRYTQLLAADPLGLSILKRIKDVTAFPILTKPSDTAALDPNALAQKERADRADEVFEWTRPIPRSPSSALKYTPFIKK